MDNRAIPSGTVIVDYTYTVSRTIGGHGVSGAASGEFEQNYVSDGSSPVSIRLDFRSNVSEQTTPFGRQTVLLEGMVDVPYEADRAYAYVSLDLSGSGHSADIVGAYAVFSDGSVDCRSATVAFTLQEA